MSPTPFAVVPIEDDGEPGELPAPASSPLAGLRIRQKAERAKRHLDLVVPAYEAPDEICVRFRPLSPTELEKILLTHEKAKPEEKNLRITAATIARAAIGVFNIDAETREPTTPAASWGAFTGERGQQLAEMLGVNYTRESGARDTVLALYDDDEAVMNKVATDLKEWSLLEHEDLSREAPKG